MRSLVLFALSALALAGCTIQQQSPHETAYDYSDYDYYDKPFATSPDYRGLDRGAVAESDGVAAEVERSTTAEGSRRGVPDPMARERNGRGPADAAVARQVASRGVQVR